MQNSTSDGTQKTGFEAFNSLLGSASKSLDRLKSKGMEKYGLSGTHTMCMRRMYESPEGLTRTELSKHLGVDRAQVTRIIGELLSEGLVEERGGSSYYRKKCVLTERGKEMTADVNARVNKILKFVSGDIEPERLDMFYETLNEICENLKKAEKLL